jgi:hypothetical protein
MNDDNIVQDLLFNSKQYFSIEKKKILTFASLIKDQPLKFEIVTCNDTPVSVTIIPE